MRNTFQNILQIFQVPVFILICVLFCIWKLLVLETTDWGVKVLPLHIGFSSYAETLADHLPLFCQVMSNFDGQHYLEIAQRGYTPLTQAFFPFYPLLIEILAHNFHLPFIVAALFISHASFFLSLVVVAQLFRLDWQKIKSRPNFVLVLCLITIIFFATSLFYGAVYNYALFFLLSTLTLGAGRSRKWFLASILGALSTFTRLNVLAL